MKPLLFAFPNDATFAAGVVRHLHADVGRLEQHEFPDGETRIRLLDECAGRDVIVVCGGSDANRRALPLMFAATTARELGARTVGLVAPYLAYLRQDQRFQAGEALSAAVYARFISGVFDWLVTVDPHLHRLRSLGEVFSIPATAVSSAPALAPWILAHVQDPLIVGPDQESEQWVTGLAARVGAPSIVLGKVRAGDRDVRVALPDPQQVAGRSPVIVDDIASSGRTLARACEALLGAGARRVDCFVVHALFAEDAEAVARDAGARRIVSTNTIAHPTNAVDVTPRVAEAIRSYLGA